MNPDQLFDYLDGKLSPADRQQLEEKLMSDAQLRRQFEVAREIHRSGRNSREVILPIEEAAAAEHGGRLGRKIAAAAFALVLLNVFLGLAVIAGKNRKAVGPDAHEAAMRRQLEESLGAAGKNALPPPSFVEDEIQITAPRTEWEAVAAKVISTAEQCGGSGARGLDEETRLTVVADVPSSRITDFRRLVLPSTSAAPSPAATAADAATANSPEARTIVQVRIAEPAR